MNLTLRPITADDQPLLYRIYASTRTEELAVVDWSDAQKAAFLEQQFSAQHRHYTENYDRTAFDLILCEGVAVGRLYVRRAADEMRIVDIAILPEHRGIGIGAKLLGDLIVEARDRATPLRIHVEKNNPALRLYERLGFRPIDDRGVYWFLEWSP